MKQTPSKSDELFSKIFHASPVAMNLFRLSDGRSVDVNNAFLSLTGYSRDEITNQSAAELDLFVDPNARNVWMKEVKEFGAAHPKDIQIRQKSGAIRDVLFTTVLLDYSGEKIVLVTAIDISERIRAEEALDESQAQLAGIINSAMDAIVTINEDQKITIFNAAAQRMFGYSAAELMGQPLDRLLPEHYRPIHKSHIERFRKTGVTSRAMGSLQALSGVRANGEEFPIEASISQIEIRGRKMLTVILRDITARKQAEDAMRFQATLLNAVGQAVIATDTNGIITYLNSAAESMYGWTANEALGRNILTVTVPQASKEQAAELLNQLTQGKSWEGEFPVQRRDGLIFPSLVHDSPVLDDTGKLIGIIGVSSDITERKQIEEELREGRERLFNIVQSAMDAIITVDKDQHIILFNAASEKIFNCRAEEVIGKSLEIFIPQQYRAGHHHHIESFSKTGTTSRKMGALIPLTALRSDGLEFPIEASISQVIVDGQQVFTVILRDITERKQAEDALRESEQRLQLATRAGNIGVWDWDIANDKLVWDDNSYSLYGIRKEDFGNVYDAWLKTLHSDDRDYIDVEVQAALRGEREYAPEFRVIRRDGEIRVMKSASQTLYDENGKARRMIGVNIDITERKQMEEALANERNLLRTLIDNLPDAIYVKDSEGRFLLKNRADAHRMGAASPEETIGKTDFDYYPAALAAQYHADDQAVMHSGQAIINQEEPVIDAANRAGWVSTTKVPLRDQQGRVIGLVGIGHDITAQKQADEEKAKLEAQLYQAYKMESVGRLAGGVAHDFNNMLGVILGHTELALYQIDPDLPQRANLEEIQKAAQRSANLTSQLLAFARQQVIAPKVLDLNETVAATLTMLQRMIGENIQLIWSPAAALWAVNIDPTQIDQLLANLCVNARDAISDVGNIMIETGNRVFDEAYCALHPDCMPGRYVMLSVRDTGNGMNEQTQAHLFEPFFTTKPFGHGTGLGLATVYGIVKQNNGFIRVSTEVGQGTTFHIYLPSHGVANVSEPEPRTAYRTPGGGETILLVEDEPSVLRLSRTMLTRLGYHVLSAETPGMAIELSGTHSGPIHLLMTDVIMPEMNGRDLGNYLVIRYPQIKRLFMSGYTAEIIAPQGVLEDGVFFIQKPFSMKDLAAKVREVIEYGKPNNG